MLKRVIFTIVLALIVASGSLLIGCTQQTTPSQSPAATTPQTTAPKPAQSSSPVAEGPVRGGVLKVASTTDAPSFDPHSDYTVKIQQFSAAVFNGLIKFDPQKAEVTNENIIPDLAEKWDISSDGKTYTFYLRQGVKFHDGQPFTATDVKYSLDRFRDPKTSAFAANIAPIDSVQIVNDYTVKVNLKYPYAELLKFMVAPYCAMLPEHLKTVSTKSTDFLVGTGPFKFKSYVPGKQYVFERNPDYFIKGLPYLDGYEVYVLAFPAYVDQFLGGRLDTAGSLRHALEDRSAILRVRQQAPEAIQATADNGATRGLIFNLQRKGAWQDVRVRQAMALVLDYQGTITAGVGGPEAGFIAPAGIVPFYMKEAIAQKELMTMLGLDKSQDERLAKAKQLMKDAGYADGFSTVCLTQDVPVLSQPALFAADLWKRYLNIDMKVDAQQQPVVLPKITQGQFDMYCTIVSSPSGTSIIESLGNFVSGAAPNPGKWSNADYDKLFQQILQETDPAKRIDEARKAQQIFYSELPYIPFHETTNGTAVRPDMRIGWPAVKAPVLQPSYTNLVAIDRIWFAGTPDAARWINTQK